MPTRRERYSPKIFLKVSEGHSEPLLKWFTCEWVSSTPQKDHRERDEREIIAALADEKVNLEIVMTQPFVHVGTLKRTLFFLLGIQVVPRHFWLRCSWRRSLMSTICDREREWRPVGRHLKKAGLRVERREGKWMAQWM